MCPKCQSENRVRNGVLKGKQRFKCKNCGCNYTLTYQEKAEKEKKDALLCPCIWKGWGFIPSADCWGLVTLR